MKGARVDGTVSSVCGQEFRERVAKVVTNEWGDDVFVAKWNDEEVTSASTVEVVLPARAGVRAGLRFNRGRRSVFFVLHQLFDRCVLVRDLSI